MFHLVFSAGNNDCLQEARLTLETKKKKNAEHNFCSFYMDTSQRMGQVEKLIFIL